MKQGTCRNGEKCQYYQTTVNSNSESNKRCEERHIVQKQRPSRWLIMSNVKRSTSSVLVGWNVGPRDEAEVSRGEMNIRYRCPFRRKCSHEIGSRFKTGFVVGQ